MAPNIKDLSPELLCHIFKYLPLREILSVAMLCKKMSVAVDMHLRLCKTIDFCQDAICGYMPSSITDDHLLSLLKKCPHLETVYGLHPVKIERRRLRKRSALTIPGIIEALSLCFNLKAIETSDLRLFEAIMQHLPQLEIIGHFQNRDGLFPPQASHRLKLQPYPKISSLHLIGVEVPELTAMPHLQHLHLQCVRFTKLQPFRAFLAQNLKSFVMKHCIGPSVPQRYLSLIIALSSSPNLRHLELVRVPLLNGLFQRAVEDSYRHNGFVNLKTLIIAGCKGVLEADLGHLMIVSSKNLETLHIQPSLTKDSLFVSLSFAQCTFPKLENLHLGYIDNLNFPGEWSNDTLLSFGLAEIPDTPSSITDSGMKVISQLFPEIKSLTVSNCPHLMVMFQWMPSRELRAWHALTDLTLQKCHCLQLSSFALFISFLPNIRVVILNDMFREPPKGCSHVGLSAGTGLGMSSAVVSNQDEHIAVQGHQQDFEHPGDEDNEDNEREFIDVENDDNPEPHFMVLQRDFFDGEDDADAERDAVAVVDGEVEGMVDGEEPLVAEDQPNEALNNELQVNDMNNNNSNSSSSTIENSVNVPSTSSASDNQSSSKDYSEYCLNETEKKPSKSAYVQTDYFDVNTITTSCTVGSNSIEDEDFDPHKPSTSKAGENLDNSVAGTSQENDTSDSGIDSDFKCDINRKREKKNCKHNFSKKSKFDGNLPVVKGSLKIENDENSSGSENIGYSNSPCSTKQLHGHCNSIDPFSNEKHVPKKPILNVKSESIESNEEFPKAFTSKKSEAEVYDIQNETNGEADLSVTNFYLSKCKSCYVRIEKLKDGMHSHGNDYTLQKNKDPDELTIKNENISSKHSEQSSANSKKKINENNSCCSSKHVGSSFNKNINSFDQDVAMKPNVSPRVSVAKNKSTKRMLKVNDASNNLNSGDIKSDKIGFDATDTFSDNNSIKNENVELWDSNQPSTSRAQMNDDHLSSLSKCATLRKSIKEENSASCRKNECRNSLPANSCLESDNGTRAASQNVCNKESVTKFDAITDNITSVKELKNDEFYVLEANNTDGSIHIVNFSRHESHRTPSCSVLVNRISCSDINHNLSKSKAKFKKIASRKLNRRSALVTKPNPSLPSTSKASDNIDLPSEVSDCSVSSKKRKYESSVAERNNPSVVPEQKFKLLKINDTDADVLMKKYLHSSHNASADMMTSENCSVACPKNIKDDVQPLENCESLPSENNKTETDSHPPKKTRRKRGRFCKGVKKVLKDCKMKPNSGNKSSCRSYCRRVQSVPMVSMISQGTQATSADIRRSVRLVRRATARARRTVASLRVSRNSSHSSKISAKTLTKRPVNTKPPPETHDKATSTSDPLLEDDAVQTLQLTSASLLSFSVISCGISDLIIDHCAQLYHVEIQACRILKRLQLNDCPELKKINVSQCPKLSISALAAPVLSLPRETFALVTYEPCMQSYHPGEGEKAILSKTAYNQSVLVCHDLSNIAHDGMQAKIKEKLLEWFRFLSKMHKDLNAVFIAYRLRKVKPCEKAEYPWFHEIRKKYGQYISDDFCFASQYQLLTNNPIFCEIFETSPLDSEFPSYHECAAHSNYSLMSNEAVDKYIRMQKKFVGFYIPITDSSQIKFL